MTQEPPPMSPALRALVDADSRRPGPSDGVRRGVYAALGVTLGVGVLAAGAAATAQGAVVATAAAAPTGAATAAGALGVVGRLALIAKTPLVGVGLGAVLGASVMAYVVKGPMARHKPAPAAPVAIAASHARSPVPAAMAPLPDERPAPPETVTTPTPPAAAPRTIKSSAAALPHHLAVNPSVDSSEPLARGPGADTLTAEQALLDPARAAIARGDGASALTDLESHERRFPGGALAQEREAMAIHALVLTGDDARAQRRADSFRARYPESVLQPMIDAALRARP